MNVLLVHGAFRGGWSWHAVAPLLRAAGHEVLHPSLLGMGELAPAPGHRGDIELGEWTAQLVGLVQLEDLHEVVLVGHSQGGLVLRAIGDRLDDRVARVALLDSPLPTRGHRGVDLIGTTPAPGTLPPRDTWLEPTPLVADSLHPAEVADWVNARLCATPLGPSLDPIDTDESAAPRSIAFCEHTPPGYPSVLARAHCIEQGVPHAVLDAPHDAPLTHPDLVAEWLLAEMAGPPA